MFNSQLIDLLRHFSPDQLSEFRLFVASPFFNREGFAQETALLLGFILKAAPSFAEEDLEREAAYQLVFPDAPLVKGKLDKVMSELHQLAKEFISVQRYMRPEHEFERLMDQADFYRTQGLSKRHEGLMQRLDEYLKDDGQHDEAFFYRDFLLNSEIHTFSNTYNLKRGDVHIQATLESLDLFYLLSKINLLNLYLIQQKVTRLTMPEGMLQTIKESQLPERYADSYPALFLSYKTFQLLEQEHTDAQAFDELSRLLTENEAAISPEHLKSLFAHLRNCCVLLVNSGRKDLLPTLLALQKQHLTRGYLYHNHEITPSAFLSIVNNALRLKEYDWTKNFISEHRGRITGDNTTQDYYHLGLAIYLFHSGQHEKALDVLPAIFQELECLLLARRLELKIYYEQDSDLLPYKMSAFKMYLSRTSQSVLSPILRDLNTNFINFLFQLHRTPLLDKGRAQRIATRIRQAEVLADREWLIERAEAIG